MSENKIPYLMMKTKVKINIFIVEGNEKPCTCEKENLTELKLTSVDVRKVLHSLIKMDCVPLIREVIVADSLELTPEIVKSMTVVIPKGNSNKVEGIQCVEISKINIEKSVGTMFWYANNDGYNTLNQDLLENLLWLRMYAENQMVISH